MKMLKVYLYFISLAVILWVSWTIQEFHVGLGYSIGVVAMLIAFFATINELTKESR
jgi:hypothetical protein